jgi:hypothetical protein
MAIPGHSGDLVTYVVRLATATVQPSMVAALACDGWGAIWCSRARPVPWAELPPSKKADEGQ